MLREGGPIDNSYGDLCQIIIRAVFQTATTCDSFVEDCLRT
jgi:hypothetical protein